MAKKIETLFVKEQLLKSKLYEEKVDLLNALLDDGAFYSLSEVDKKIENYMKGKVN